ncbi:hypothetical protein HGP14_23335 [Rhizobium sp. P32RR-XVIII]|uniref:hypothetical protein n=1 Tax=Rhizobium sp. P32RR-XVIII TaxID=2726738 RepID=UPI00145664D1|nr:hypothetical protein [Rhizobium sp. P32RR-XVIII]NLS06263.1 hypothetical protein [Rhizobium sp. P32RR-XVIII]
MQHNEIDVFSLLPDDPEISDKDVIIAEGATHWRDAEAKPMACDFDTTLERFDWAEAQNARRQREARRKQAA